MRTARARIWSAATAGLPIAILLMAWSPVTGKTTPFCADFENGALDGWTVGGRQLGTNVADVVTRGGSKHAHLYHRHFTEITLHRDFGFSLDDIYHFDLEVDVTTTPPPSPPYYGWSYMAFNFLDSTDTRLGYVWYGAATTDYPVAVISADPWVAANLIPENVMNHYEVNAADLLSQIAIDNSQVSKMRILLGTYSSTWPYPDVSAELWVDNIKINPDKTSPIPAPSAALLGCTGLGLLARFRRRLR